MKAVRGFSILETIIAIAILSGALVVGIDLLSFTLRHSRIAANELVAAHLAAEGVEVIRNLRDENWLRRLAWSDWRVAMVGTGTEQCYEVAWNTTDGTSAQVSCSATPRRLQVDAAGHYCYSCGGTATLYTRTVRVGTDGLALHQLRVRATISWNEPSGARSITVEDILYDWR